MRDRSQRHPEAPKEIPSTQTLPESVSRGELFPGEVPSNRKYYMSYDVVTGRNRYYGN